MPDLKWNDFLDKNIIVEVQLAKLNKDIYFLNHENSKNTLFKSRDSNFTKNAIKNVGFNCSFDFGI